jgi:hypothetical protein
MICSWIIWEKNDWSKKESVIPSEVDPFVRERINAVEGPAVSAPKARAGLQAANSPPAKAGSSTPHKDRYS